jgi:hypothetical protein
MTSEASQLMNEALRTVGLNGSFSTADLGAKIGLSKPQAEAAARDLSNAGVLALGFDCAAFFTPEFRKARKPAEKKVVKRPRKTPA